MTCFTVHATDTQCKARSGTFFGKVETPAPLIPARLLTPDLLEESVPTPSVLSVHAFTCFQQPTSTVLKKMDCGYKKVINLDNDDYIMFMNTRNERHFEGPGPTSDEGTHLWSPAGKKLITPENYMENIAVFQPDCFTALSDEVPSRCGIKRARKSATLSQSYLDRCINIHQQSSIRESSKLFASIVGTDKTITRLECAKHAASKDGVSGFVLGGFGLGESPEERLKLLNEVINELPAQKPRVFLGVSNILDVLEAVSQGIDLVDSVYPQACTDLNHALVFPLDPPFEVAEDSRASIDPADEPFSDPVKLQLQDTRFEKDKRPLLKGCECTSCKAGHSRGYIHHLLNTQEMLGGVLLDAHNLHHYNLWFQKIREAIQKGQFEEYRSGMRAFLQKAFE